MKKQADAVPRKRGRPKKDGTETPKKIGKVEVKGLEETAAKYHSLSDEELTEFIEPTPERQDLQTRRLNAEQLDARLVLLHRMLIRKVPPQEIRNLLNVSETLYYRLKDQLEARTRLDVTKVDVPYLIGDTLSFYDEIRSMALVMSSSNQADNRTKLMAMSTAMRAEEGKNDFLTKCGVYSEPVVKHFVHGLVSTGNFTVIDGNTERLLTAEEINQEIAMRMREYAHGRSRAINCIKEG